MTSNEAATRVYNLTMRSLAPLVLAALLSSPSLAQELVPPTQAPFDVVATWTSCAQCHAAPDKRIDHDARWIGLNETTACLTDAAAKPENRRALIDFLKAGKAPMPTLVRTRHPAEAQERPEATGIVEVPTTSGSALLRRANGERPVDLRVHWEASGEGRFADLPEGDYALISYSFYRVDRAGRHWTASATVQEGEEPDVLEVRPDEPVRLPATPRMFSDLKAEVDGQTLEVTFQKRNAAGDRMTLTCDGKLVEPTWVLENEDGTDAAAGPMAPT